MLEIQRPRGAYGAFTGTTFPAPVFGVMGWNNGVPLGTGTVLNFGNNLTASLSGTVLRLDATGGSPFSGVDQIGVAVQHLGGFIATGTTLNVMGSVSMSGTVINVRVPKTVALVNSTIAGGVVFTNLVAADTTYSAAMLDLVGYTQCRLGGVFGSAPAASASGSFAHLMWMTGSNYAALNELALNKDTEEGRLRWIASAQRMTDWFNINQGAAYPEVGLHLRITGGNGTADPNLLGLFAEFR